MTNSKNILLVMSKFPPEYSGPGVRIPRLYKWLKGYHLEVICNGVEHTHSKKYEHDGVPVQRIIAGWVHKIRGVPHRYKQALIYQCEFLQTLWALSRRQNIDLLHIAGHSGGTAAALVWAKIRNIPVLLELVTANAPHQQKIFFFFRTPRLTRLMVIALTQDMEKKCLNTGLDPSKIWRRPNPIDEHKFCIPSSEEKKKSRAQCSHFSNDQIILVNVAKIMPQKNQILMIEILNHLPPSFVALIAGPLIADGPLWERDRDYIHKLKVLITNYEVEDRVHLVTDFVLAEDYMKAGDLYLMPAWNEGFGTPMMEAMSCGLPVIANQDEPAFCEWIEDAKNGFLCDIKEPKQWAHAIEKTMLLSETQRLEISKNIHKNAGQDMIYTHYKSLINKLITNHQMHDS